MRILLWVAVVIGVAGVSRASERPLLRGGEAPRATDLLRAQRLAEEAQKRRQLPAPSSRHGWVRGGSGWDDVRRRVSEKKAPGVTIRVGAPRRAARERGPDPRRRPSPR